MKVLESATMRLQMLRTQGDVLEMLATYAPGSPPPPRHYHPLQREQFTVESGALRFFLNGAERVVRAGESVIIEPGTVHTVRNASASEPARTRWETRPALRSAEMFEAILEMQRQGANLLTAAAIGHEFRHEMVLAWPPRLVQSCVFGLLAPLARALGKGVSRAEPPTPTL
ncbi:MAG: cupin domain-containing protein [Polyangiales bacterium]